MVVTSSNRNSHLWLDCLYVGMARKANGHPYISVASDELKSLLIHRDKSY